MSENRTTEKLLADLVAWTYDTGSFHSDRELADRVLLATDWRCIADPEHPAKVKWEFGVNPVYTSWEPHHPHPIQSIDAAIGQLPYGWRICSMVKADQDGEWKVTAVRDGSGVGGAHKELPLALSIVAVKAWETDHAR